MPGCAANTLIVTCKDCGARWGKHWPCEGTEREIRFGEHQCGECYNKQREREIDEETKDIPEDCGRLTCSLKGQKHVHMVKTNA
jgi:hypothetical protein